MRLVIFCKWPEAGRVKTRLGRDIGMARAAALYRRMAEETVARLRGAGAWRCVVAFDPAEREAEMRAWLGGDGLAYEAQREGDLGARMLAAVEGPTVIVGTDCPELEARRVEEAFGALAAGCEVVLGPTVDGGYYLIGLDRARGELFGDMPWSTDRVLPETRRRCREHGLRTLELELLRDIDEAGDLRAMGDAG